MARGVAVVLLNWNGWRDTVNCIRSLEAMAYPEHRVIVIDNGSTDDSVQQIRSAWPGGTLIESGKNLGFGGGCNIGIQYALEHGAEYIWLLNNDTVVEQDALKTLVEAAENDPRIGAVGSVIYYFDEPTRVQVYGGGRINLWTGVSSHLTTDTPEERIDYLTGASMLLRSRALQETGLFNDRRFFMYWEDADLCFRLRRAGWRLAVASASRIRHKESASLGKTNPVLNIYFNRSAVIFFRLHSVIPGLPVLIGGGGRLLKRLLRGDFAQASAVWRGLCQGMAERLKD